MFQDMPKPINGESGGLNRTELWNTGTIPSTYTGGTIDLSESMMNYDYLEFEWKVTASSTTTSKMLLPVSDFKAAGTGSTTGAKYYFGQRSSVNSCRYIAYATDTSVTIGADYRQNAAASYNNIDFPISINGVKVG